MRGTTGFLWAVCFFHCLSAVIAMQISMYTKCPGWAVKKWIFFHRFWKKVSPFVSTAMNFTSNNNNKIRIKNKINKIKCNFLAGFNEIDFKSFFSRLTRAREKFNQERRNIQFNASFVSATKINMILEIPIQFFFRVFPCRVGWLCLSWHIYVAPLSSEMQTIYGY